MFSMNPRRKLNNFLFFNSTNNKLTEPIVQKLKKPPDYPSDLRRLETKLQEHKKVRITTESSFDSYFGRPSFDVFASAPLSSRSSFRNQIRAHELLH